MAVLPEPTTTQMAQRSSGCWSESGAGAGSCCWADWIDRRSLRRDGVEVTKRKGKLDGERKQR